MSTPAELIRSLIDKHGMREHQIVTELEKLGVDVTQATINRLKTGKHRSTKFEIGEGLQKLHKRCARRARSEAHAP